MDGSGQGRSGISPPVTRRDATWGTQSGREILQTPLVSVNPKYVSRPIEWPALSFRPATWLSWKQPPGRSDGLPRTRPCSRRGTRLLRERLAGPGSCFPNPGPALAVTHARRLEASPARTGASGLRHLRPAHVPGSPDRPAWSRIYLRTTRLPPSLSFQPESEVTADAASESV